MTFNPGTRWEPLPDGWASDIAYGSNGVTYHVGHGDQIFQLDVSSATWVHINLEGLAISVGPDGSLWFVAPDRTIRRRHPNGDLEIYEGQENTKARDIGVDVNGVPWIVSYDSVWINLDHAIYRWNFQSEDWEDMERKGAERVSGGESKSARGGVRLDIVDIRKVLSTVDLSPRLWRHVLTASSNDGCKDR